jgi:hypothetical protein
MVGFANRYQTAEPWADARLVHHARKTPSRGDLHVNADQRDTGGGS